MTPQPVGTARAQFSVENRRSQLNMSQVNPSLQGSGKDPSRACRTGLRCSVGRCFRATLVQLISPYPPRGSGGGGGGKVERNERERGGPRRSDPYFLRQPLKASCGADHRPVLDPCCSRSGWAGEQGAGRRIVVSRTMRCTTPEQDRPNARKSPAAPQSLTGTRRKPRRSP